MSMQVKREKFRGKFFNVARVNGRIAAMQRWSRKTNVDKAKRIFKKNRSFDKDIKVTQLASKPFREVTDERKKPVIPKKKPFRVVVSGLLKNGVVIAASSMSQFWGSIKEAKDIAMESFFERLAQHFNKEYDADEGIKLSNKVRSIKTSIVFLR